ncbi:MAG: tryptophan-rich sensory protein [Verrucomicrobia bacterium]|nr:tryptophan-rich sensory protein [Verrucomicrobiota bacterium]MDA1065625.1 tryptophan-rich sensory protein [Verrucomicrobiota bacterium]
MVLRLVTFLLINFAALGIGSLLMDNGPASDWYFQLNKAPWTPPGWLFGLAWTLIVICFAFYMSYAWEVLSDKISLMVLFAVQWFLNTSWNLVFFRYHQSFLGLVIIALLGILVACLLFAYLSRLKVKTLFILPYFLWLLVATSLNLYIVVRN